MKGGVNTFTYVGSNPLTYSDPLGLKGLMAGGHFWELAVLDNGSSCKPLIPAIRVDDYGCVDLGSGTSFCPSPGSIERIAPEKLAIDIAKRIERDLGKEAQRAFHDIDHLVDRRAAELRADAREIYYAAKKDVPGWLK